MPIHLVTTGFTFEVRHQDRRECALAEQHGCSAMRLLRGLLMDSIAINFNHEEDAVLKKNKFGFDPAILLSAADKDWEGANDTPRDISA